MSNVQPEEMSEECKKLSRKSLRKTLDDAHRMIRYVAQGKVEDKTDLDYLRQLVESTEKVESLCVESSEKAPNSGEILAKFFEHFAVISHIIYPVTVESLRAMEGLSIFPRPTRSKRQSLALWGLALLCGFIGVVVTPCVLTYSLHGAQIIERMDKTIKDRISRGEEFQEFIKTNAQQKNKQSSATILLDPSFLKLQSLCRRTYVNISVMNESVSQLDTWNRDWLGEKLLAIFKAKKEKTINMTAKNEEDTFFKKYKDAKSVSELIALMDYLLISPFADESFQSALKTKFASLKLLQILNSCLLLLLFGFCGSAAFIIKEMIKQIQSYTFIGINWTILLRIILGTITGFFVGQLADNNDLSKLLQINGDTSPEQISLISPLALAFIGGYCIDLLFSIMNRFIFAITNDERYLPVDEQLKRKVNVERFMRPKAVTDHGAQPIPNQPIQQTTHPKKIQESAQPAKSTQE